MPDKPTYGARGILGVGTGNATPPPAVSPLVLNPPADPGPRVLDPANPQDQLYALAAGISLGSDTTPDYFSPAAMSAAMAGTGATAPEPSTTAGVPPYQPASPDINSMVPAGLAAAIAGAVGGQAAASPSVGGGSVDPTLSQPTPPVAPATAGASIDPNAAAPATTAANPSGLRDVALPTFNPLPTAPTPLPVAAPPTYDAAGNATGRDNALSAALIPAVIASLFGGRKVAGGISQFLPGVIASAVAGNTEHSAADLAHRTGDYNATLAAQQLEDERRLRQYQQNAQSVTAGNQAAQNTFEDQSQLRGQDATAAYRSGQVGNAAARITAKTRGDVVGMDAASQESYILDNPEKAAAMGLQTHYDSAGNYLPYVTNKATSDAANAAAHGATAAAKGVEAQAADRRATAYAKRVDDTARQYGITNDLMKQKVASYVKHNNVSNDVALQKVAQGEETIRIRQGNLDLRSKAMDGVSGLAPSGLKLQKLLKERASNVQHLYDLTKHLDVATEALETPDAKEKRLAAAEGYQALIDYADQQIAPLKAWLGKNKAYATPPAAGVGATPYPNMNATIGAGGKVTYPSGAALTPAAAKGMSTPDLLKAMAGG